MEYFLKENNDSVIFNSESHTVFVFLFHKQQW